ncbi:peptide chain release factor N(5)-glutamine methyltransferase [Calderihabitans maritimus]|uniref:Release factor glutamine methyltransferase n=1 Tax=Calderihabitans maritimus TaxID=1246530 RepID=A0A1Z5HWA2_9FIRM|nr:peptide chain release factor N(5)-glutamine methyltransferase [Calderihabitans maritimus]GAW93816.1 HemK family modification methylase [Calderihabitans maritimus]
MERLPAVTARKAIKEAKDRLERAGIETALSEAQQLLGYVLGCSRTALLIRVDQILTAGDYEKYMSLVKKRAERYPLQYLTGHQEFMAMDFLVNPNVLIPRPDTEVVVETALELIKKYNYRSVVDVGTGSGAIAISLARLATGIQVYAVDFSQEALKLARENALRLGVAKQVKFIQGDLLGPFFLQEKEKKHRIRQFDLVVSNPPYIPSAQIENLQPEVRYEPRAALDGGPDGLEVYRRLIPQAADVLRPEGHLVLEIGCDQAEQVVSLIRTNGCFEHIQVGKDYARRDRVVVARRR